MKRYRIAIPSFPGSNGEIDNLAVLKRCGLDAFLFRWNDSLEKLAQVDGYFFGAGFSYEDRGRSGMVAARDPLFRHLHEEAQKGKVIVGNCNGAQVLVESGLIPVGDRLRMCLAHNLTREPSGRSYSPGFLNEWVWITPACKRGRCATADWEGTMHIPYAHGEGRFVTLEPDLMEELRANDQIAFQYSDASGKVSPFAPITPNGSTDAIAGICNKEGNVVALMPHPERTPLGDQYFTSIRSWLDLHPTHDQIGTKVHAGDLSSPLTARTPMKTEILIDTIITNNEERTVEQAARRVVSSLSLKQYRYVGMEKDRSRDLLQSLSFFNPHKEVAYKIEQGSASIWNSSTKSWDAVTRQPIAGIPLLRRDIPDTKADALGQGAQTGVLYDCSNVEEEVLTRSSVSEIFSNPNASTLERISY
ncbi:MAG: phosphoribosylformylglycinamidine synthase subunit PurQ [Candidatus Peribacteraceae bacterium]